MTERQHPRPGGRARPRRLARFSLVAVLLTLFVSALPGTAFAAPPRAPKAIPLADCYAQNANGSYTVILGYNSTYTSTQTIAQGTRNYATPSTYTSQLPTVFEPGEQHGAAKLVVSQADFASGNVSWYLDGTTLNYGTAAKRVSPCTSAQLPSLAHGGALAVLLLIAGAIGVLMIRRVRRQLALPAG